ncbi:MAG: ATP-dependent zinc metalloprotease FtsH [Rhodoluna sp.]|jgi:cell division protease FtsH|nr:ATP-dependent zinc metalloprotease FtsH [Rhodoluna sp.]
MKLKKILAGPFIWIFVAILVLLVGSNMVGGQSVKKVDTAYGLKLIQLGQAKEVTVLGTDQRVDVVLESPDPKYGEKIQFFYVQPRGTQVAEIIANADISEGYNDDVQTTPWYLALLGTLLPFVIIGAIFWFLMSGLQGGNSKVMNFGKSRAKMVTKETSNVTFADVAGSDEALEELTEIKEFLKEPEKFQKVGAKIPRGVLLYGPPGTGKTLLAKAVAGEAGVPFFAISGSDFVEMFVGVGASRVRDLFEQAKQAAPAIIFVDEIDAVGRHRGAGIGGGNDEREQTLNQLLVEMDGFDSKTNVILIAATNRADILDPALLRPGRFDRQIGVGAPDLLGREQILKVHAKNKPISDKVDMASVARRTPGFTGADLANVLNEAALLTARQDESEISAATLDEAIDRVIGGPQKKSRLMQDRERLNTAYHEAGHALVAASLNNSDPVSKVTILPRGRALGYTMVLPLEDRYSVSRNQLLDQIAYAMGGRVAEEIVFHDPTTGASNDFEKATNIARDMVIKYGFSAKLGATSFGNGGEVFIGRDMAQAREYSEATAQQIDAEVRLILDAAHDEAYKALMTNRKVLDAMAKELMERETLQAEDIAKIFKPVKKLPKRAQWLSKKSRPVSKQGPIAIPDKGSNAARARVAKAEAAAEAKAAAKKPVAKKPVAKKAAPKKPVAKKAAPKRTVAKKK